MELRLRPWQAKALKKAKKWLLQTASDKRFLINAAPGSGKTLAAIAISKTLIDLGLIDRVFVIAPRTEVVNQWSKDFKWVTDRFMGKVTARDGDIGQMGMDICVTWAAVQGLLPEIQAICQSQRVLVICDEHHHAAVKAAWGSSADSAFVDARFTLILTGTPIRSDGAKSVWLAYDDVGALDHPEAGTYTLTYGDAVDLGYCRPVTFHRHEGQFTIDLDDGTAISVSGQNPAQLSPELRRVPGLQKSLDFYRLACIPQYEPDKVTPLASGYQSSLVKSGSAKLDELRNRMPEAGGLVIAPSIEMAEYMADVLEQCEGERPMVVHSNLPNPDSKIGAFRNNNKRWLVSVAMVSEGVDIKRLRLLIYLPFALTELAFRQAIGRIVRSWGNNDTTRAYVIMPSFEIFEEFARRVESEMHPSQRNDERPARSKLCPICQTECPVGAKECPECRHDFPKSGQKFKACSDCGSLNSLNSSKCQACGEKFSEDFSLSLDDALRRGAIVRGMDIDEAQVVVGEKIAPIVRERLLSSGDETLVRIVKTLPEESWGRLQAILAAADPT